MALCGETAAAQQISEKYSFFNIPSSQTIWEQTGPSWAPAICWPVVRTGRWRCRWTGSPWPLWWPAGRRSSPSPRGLLSSGAGWGWRTPSLRSHSERRLSPSVDRQRVQLSSAASGRCGWTQRGRPLLGHPASPSTARKSGIGRPEEQWRSLQENENRFCFV